MTLAVIHNPERVERKEHFDNQCKIQGITDVIWFPAIFAETVQRGISIAHKQCVRYAQAHKLKEIIIVEDDVHFVDYGSFDYYIANKPESYDIYFGGISGGNIMPDTGIINTNLSGFFCYMVHERFYDDFLSADETVHIDSWVSTALIERRNTNRPVYICCYPMAAITCNGYSDNFKTFMDYSQYFQSYKLWQRS